MSQNIPFVLDFSSPDIKNTIGTCLEDESLHPILQAAVHFSSAWLNGNTEFGFNTSGTSGNPKQIWVRKERIIASVESTAAFFDLKKGNKVFICLNTEFTGGKMMLARALHLQLEAHVVLPNNVEFPIRDMYDLGAFVPAQLYSIFRSENPNALFSNFKNILIGGAAINEELLGKIRKIQNVNFYETFGMTETLSHIAMKKLGERAKEAPFEVMPGVEIKVNDDGCLMVKAAVTDNEWIETNDMIEMVDHAHFKWKGRFDNVVNSGGIKLYPEEIEKNISQILRSNSNFQDFFLTSVPDERLGEKLILVLEGEEHDTAELLNAIKSLLPQFHSPHGIFFKKQFDRTVSGKLIRKI